MSGASSPKARTIKGLPERSDERQNTTDLPKTTAEFNENVKNRMNDWSTENEVKKLSEKLKKCSKYMNGKLLERDDAIAASLLALVTRHHCLSFGPPGTAKSLLADTFFECVHETRPLSNSEKYEGWDKHRGIDIFKVVLHAGSSLDDFVGPVDLQELSQHKYKRNLNRKLCGETTYFAFLDEVFKAQGKVLSVLLSVMNEREYFDGTSKVDIPLMTIVAASNEVPTHASQQALYDRFLFRTYVAPISRPDTMWDFQGRDNVQIELKDDDRIKISHIETLHAFAKKYVDLKGATWLHKPAGVRENIDSRDKRRKEEGEHRLAETHTYKLVEHLDAECLTTLGILHVIDFFVCAISEGGEAEDAYEEVRGGLIFTDRRRMQLGVVLRVVAAACNRRYVHPLDLAVLIYASWRTDSQRKQVEHFIVTTLRYALSRVEGTKRRDELSEMAKNPFVPERLKNVFEKPFTEDEAREYKQYLKMTVEKANAAAGGAKNRRAADLEKHKQAMLDQELEDKRSEQQKINQAKAHQARLEQQERNRVKNFKRQRDKEAQAGEKERSEKEKQRKATDGLQSLLSHLYNRDLTEQEDERMAQLLKDGAVPNHIIVGGCNDTGYNICCWQGHARVFSKLIAGPVPPGTNLHNLNQKDTCNEAPLHQMCNRQPLSKWPEFISTLAGGIAGGRVDLDWTLTGGSGHNLTLQDYMNKKIKQKGDTQAYLRFVPAWREVVEAATARKDPKIPGISLPYKLAAPSGFDLTALKNEHKGVFEFV